MCTVLAVGGVSYVVRHTDTFGDIWHVTTCRRRVPELLCTHLSAFKCVCVTFGTSRIQKNVCIFKKGSGNMTPPAVWARVFLRIQISMSPSIWYKKLYLTPYGSKVMIKTVETPHMYEICDVTSVTVTHFHVKYEIRDVKSCHMSHIRHCNSS